MVVDLHPLDLADGRHPDRASPVDELGEAVLVVQRGIATPGGLEGRGERRRGGGPDEGGADVLAVSQRGIHQLADPPEAAARADDHLHLLLAEALDVVDGDDDAGRGASTGRLRGQQRFLHRDRVHGVPVDQQRARREVVTGQPERIGVVPLLRPVVIDQRQPDSVPPLQDGRPFPHRVRRVADHHRDVAQTDRGQVAKRDVQDGDPAVDRQQRLGQQVRVRPQPSPGACGEDHPDQPRLRPPSPAIR